ncbi:MAG TPA: hypothetical protein VHO23_00680 [Candidatus Paceibacterota bacterium]|nr:hypothetical protein [Candidatus Paceibacterota bacterium]
MSVSDAVGLPDRVPHQRGEKRPRGKRAERRMLLVASFNLHPVVRAARDGGVDVPVPPYRELSSLLAHGMRKHCVTMNGASCRLHTIAREISQYTKEGHQTHAHVTLAHATVLRCAYHIVHICVSGRETAFYVFPTAVLLDTYFPSRLELAGRQTQTLRIPVSRPTAPWKKPRLDVAPFRNAWHLIEPCNGSAL